MKYNLDKCAKFANCKPEQITSVEYDRGDRRLIVFFIDPQEGTDEIDFSSKNVNESDYLL
jgi:hypothetical protein